MRTNKEALNIGIIYPGRFPWNRGVGQLYDAFKIMGHNPVVMCVAPENRFSKEKYENINVIHMRNSEAFIKRMKAVPQSLNYFWKLFIKRAVKKYCLDCVFVRETNLLWQSVSVANEFKIPCFVDMRENLGLMYSIVESNRSMKLFQNKLLVSYIESKYLHRTSHIFTVSQELKDWVINRYKIKKKVSVLGNYPNSDFIAKANFAQTKRKRQIREPIKLVFAGNVTPIKGVQNIILSLPLVLQAHKCTLTIIGSGQYVEKLKDIATEFDVKEHVIFKNLVKPEFLPAELSKYDIGVCPYLVNDFTNQTMPGKLFEYMALGLPILSSARKPVVRVIEEEGCGVIYNSQQVKEISRKIRYMIENFEHTLDMGEKGRTAVLDKYNSESTVKTLENIIFRYF